MATTGKIYTVKAYSPRNDKTKNEEIELYTNERKRAIDISHDLFGVYYYVNACEVVGETETLVTVMHEYKED